MRVGTILPHMGPAAIPEFLVRSAQHAEALGYDSAWVAERLLYPLAPRTPYAGTPDGTLPEFYKRVFEPVEALTFEVDRRAEAGPAAAADLSGRVHPRRSIGWRASRMAGCRPVSR